jgi:serine/threonine protein kinase
MPATPARPVTALHLGKEPFPGYRLEQMLARGPGGEVWQSSTSAGTMVALKFIPCANSTMGAHAVRAIGLVQPLRHPGLTRVHTIWTNRGYVVVAMEMADGSLLDLLDAYLTEYGRPPDAASICVYLAQVAEAIDFLNARHHKLDGALIGMQHCNIKPSNLLLFGETVKLTDFGLASPISTNVKPHRRAGTRGYAAPEVWQGLTQRAYGSICPRCQLLPAAHGPAAISRRCRPEAVAAGVGRRRPYGLADGRRENHGTVSVEARRRARSVDVAGRRAVRGRSGAGAGSPRPLAVLPGIHDATQQAGPLRKLAKSQDVSTQLARIDRGPPSVARFPPVQQ